jgi:hypothetical protein
METSLKKLKVIDVLDPKIYRPGRVYKIEGKDLPVFDNVKLDFSALPETQRTVEVNKFHTNIENDGTVIARIHQCAKTNFSPKLNENERYAFIARRESERYTIPAQCPRCHRQ